MVATSNVIPCDVCKKHIYLKGDKAYILQCIHTADEVVDHDKGLPIGIVCYDCVVAQEKIQI